MKLALRRKANQKIVAQKEAVLGLLERCLSAQFGDAEEVIEASHQLEADADALGLSVTGENWETRLVIKAKGGGTHFDDATRERAGHAYRRGAAVHSVAGWTEQLRARKAQLERSTRSDGAGKATLLERARDLVKATKRTMAEICDEDQMRHVEPEMVQLQVPQNLRDEAAAVRSAAPPLADWAHELCMAALRSLMTEAKMTQKFRAPGTLAVLRLGDELMMEMWDFVPAQGSAVPQLLDELRDAIAEVEPLCEGIINQEELDEEV